MPAFHQRRGCNTFMHACCQKASDAAGEAHAKGTRAPKRARAMIKQEAAPKLRDFRP
jgi:hypothetical protein